ncbi:hypothetical protein ABH905_002285 [Pseudomonas frederiksbergensis]|uniref:hypothetical protein n=1 Tax=Pseudomonas frederiksbergensis TaxID=104087 RepID=UPI003D237BD9
MHRAISKSIFITLVSCWVGTAYAQLPNAIEVAGQLTVHSSIEGQKSSPLLLNILGHSWLSYESSNGQERWTVGTWDGGIDVGSRVSREGVNYNLETRRQPGAYRRVTITENQHATLLEAIKLNDKWTPFGNCSYFASTVWNTVTGEHLSNWSEIQDRELWELFIGDEFGGSRIIPLPSPSGLFDWIFISNGNTFNNDNGKLKKLYDKANPQLLTPPDVRMAPFLN